MAMKMNNAPEAMHVRKVTTARGENPFRIAQRPKTGDTPRNTADDKAAITPMLCCLAMTANRLFTVI